MADSRGWNGGKALTVLDESPSSVAPCASAELLAESPYPKATLYRFVQTLTNQGMLQLRPRAADLCAGPAARPAGPCGLAGLVAGAHRAAHLDQRCRAPGRRCIWRSSTAGRCFTWTSATRAHRSRCIQQAGKVGPAYCTGVGKAMLALPARGGSCRAMQDRLSPLHRERRHDRRGHARRTRRDPRARHAFDREEHEPGIICIAVPILAARAAVLGAVSVTSTTVRTILTG
jgi:IclR family KDG regulon transcriptional repressor